MKSDIESMPTPVPSVLLAVQRAAHFSIQQLVTTLVDLDLGASEINALANLADGRSRTVSQLAAAVGIRPTTLTSVLDRLERRGLILRGARAGDRRSVLIELTDAGRSSAAAVSDALADLERRALADARPAALATLHNVLTALTSEEP